MKLTKLTSFFQTMSQRMTNAYLAFCAILFTAVNANAASIFGEILGNQTGQTIITTLFVVWGASVLIEAFGMIMEGQAGAVKKGMQAVILMVIGWQWAEIITLFGFDKVG